MRVLVLLFTAIEKPEEVFGLNSSFLCICLVNSVIADISQICAQDLDER